ncbi:hypothetical protein D9M73_195540 [compost metagenome]
MIKSVRRLCQAIEENLIERPARNQCIAGRAVSSQNKGFEPGLLQLQGATLVLLLQLNAEGITQQFAKVGRGFQLIVEGVCFLLQISKWRSLGQQLGEWVSFLRCLFFDDRGLGQKHYIRFLL